MYLLIVTLHKSVLIAFIISIKRKDSDFEKVRNFEFTLITEKQKIDKLFQQNLV